jgi:hypothetical protein
MHILVKGKNGSSGVSGILVSQSSLGVLSERIDGSCLRELKSDSTSLVLFQRRPHHKLLLGSGTFLFALR